MEGLTLLAKGAEADLWLDPDWNGLRALIKRRVEKRYRNPELDMEIRRFRTIHEADIIHRAKEAGVPAPIIYQVDLEEATIVMEHIYGERVRDVVEDLGKEERGRLFRVIGEMAGRLHRAGIVHGDLTTSNMIRTQDRVVLIDFGLGEISRETEKRGVDINLMHRMLTSTHFRHADDLFKAFKDGYNSVLGKEAEEALTRMDEIAKRGRYVERV